jgi:hypothetical protein
LRSRRLAEEPHPVSEHDRDDLHDDLVQPTERQHLPSNLGTEDAYRSTTGELLARASAVSKSETGSTVRSDASWSG